MSSSPSPLRSPTSGSSPAGENERSQTRLLLNLEPLESATKTGALPRKVPLASLIGRWAKLTMSSLPSPLKSPTEGNLADAGKVRVPEPAAEKSGSIREGDPYGGAPEQRAVGEVLAFLHEGHDVGLPVSVEVAHQWNFTLEREELVPTPGRDELHIRPIGGVHESGGYEHRCNAFARNGSLGEADEVIDTIAGKVSDHRHLAGTRQERVPSEPGGERRECSFFQLSSSVRCSRLARA